MTFPSARECATGLRYTCLNNVQLFFNRLDADGEMGVTPASLGGEEALGHRGAHLDPSAPFYGNSSKGA